MILTPQQALDRISSQSGIRRVKGESPSLSLSMTIHGKMYAFSGGGRTIIAPNDDRLPAVLADCSTIPVRSKKSPELTWWLNEYADEMAASVSEGKVVAKAPAKAPENINIVPLLGNIKWGQKAPFWQNLKFPHPTKANTKVYCCTGCVATAIGMVLYYLSKKGYRRGCLPTKAYTTTKYKYSVTAMPSMPMFDWTSMTDGKPTTTKGKAAVAKLMEYCGRAVKADYGYSSTSAPMANVATALKDYFGLGDARRLQNLSNASLKAEIIAELQKGNPVIMCGSGNSECHCFVCDGYRSSDDMFHFNWGYEGDGDGWFKLTALNPSTHDFSNSKNAIVGLTPYILGDVNGDGRINMSDVTATINATNKGEYDRQMDVNSDGNVDKKDTEKITDIILNK